MPIPFHGPFCRTYVKPTMCDFCSESVWFFACNCGSKVFFEALGAPWPQHCCEAREVKKIIDELTQTQNMSSEAIYTIIEERERSSGVSMSEEMRVVIERHIGVRMYQPTVVPVAPDSGVRDVCGKVVSVNSNINLFKRLGYNNNPMGKSFLGELAGHTYNEVILRDQPDHRNCRREYRLLIRQNHPSMSAVKQNKFLIGDLMHVRHAKGTEFVLVDFNITG